jgi:hypothetical protein
MNSAGKVIVPAARETVTRPSSCGWRRPLPVVHHARRIGISNDAVIDRREPHARFEPLLQPAFLLVT